MKKAISILLLCVASHALKAQTIDTNSLKPYSVVKLVTPFAPKWGDTTKVCYMMIQSLDDNLKDKATFRYVLFQQRWAEASIIKTPDGLRDTTVYTPKGGIPIVDGYVKCEGADYKNWDGNNKYPFTFVASKIGIAIK